MNQFIYHARGSWPNRLRHAGALFIDGLISVLTPGYFIGDFSTACARKEAQRNIETYKRQGLSI